ncbi:MAG: hypothetical protein DMG35_20660 [Acidobacteria bacterium]|nr:MAG: hypothetical protein DMG35_20660 [Acidobacteriota bacterium]
MNITNPYSMELMVAHASKVSEKVQLLVSNGRQHVTNTHRDTLALAYWTILFEYHNGILTLVRTGNPTSAFALLRVFEEAFLKLFLVMCGTDKQVQAIWEGTYNTDFAAVGAQIDEKLGKEPLFGPKLKGQVKTLHGFTHSGFEQLVRQLTRLPDGSSDIAPNYTDKDVRQLVQETMPIIFLAGAFLTEFLNYPDENKAVVAMFNDYLETQVMSLKLDEMVQTAGTLAQKL